MAQEQSPLISSSDDLIDKLVESTEDVNDLLCTNYNFVNVTNDYGSDKILPINCENGTTKDQLNKPIEILKNELLNKHYLDKEPPYCMTKEAVEDFSKLFLDDNSEDDTFYFSIEDVLQSLVPGQFGLINNIIRLMDFYDIPLDNNLRRLIYRLGDGCENDSCCARVFVPLICSNVDIDENYYNDRAFDYGNNDQKDYPLIPKLRNPKTYRFAENLFSNAKKAKEYLDSLSCSLTNEVTTQCVICDIICFFFNKNKNDDCQRSLSSKDRRYDLNCFPIIHEHFYNSLSLHKLISDNNKEFNILSSTSIHMQENGRYTVHYRDKQYE